MAPVLHIFLAASAIAAVFAAEGSVVITGCQNGTTTLLENSSLYLNCYDLTNGDGVVHWTLTTESGAQIPLGTCHAVNNCTSSVTNARITRSSPARSRCVLSRILRNMTGNIACTVRTKNGVGTDTCRVNIVRVGFSKAMIDMSEGKTGSEERVNLSPIGRISTTLTLTTESGNVIALGNCTTVQYKCYSKAGVFNLTIFPRHLQITPKTAPERGFAGNISVSVSYGSETETAAIPLNVHSSPKVGNCSIDVHQHNRTAVLSCDILKAFSSAGIYRFQVLEFSPNSSFIYKDDYESLPTAKNSSELKRHEERSFLPSMHSYKDTPDDKTYYRGRLEYSWRLSSFNKDPKFASVLVCTSSSVYRCTFPDPWFIRLPKVDFPMDCDCDCDSDTMTGSVIGLGTALAVSVAVIVALIFVMRQQFLRRSREGNSSVRENKDFSGVI